MDHPAASSRPLNYLILLYPCFQLLDLAGPLDILNLLSMTPSYDLSGITLTILASTLDPIPTKPIPPKSGAWTYDPKDLVNLANSTGVVNTACNQYILPDMTFDEYAKRLSTADPNLKPIDVIFIPGGIGTRINRVYPAGSSNSNSDNSDNSQSTVVSNVADLREFVKFAAPHAKYIMTVCTGSDTLAQTNLLDNRRATTNMTRFDDVVRRNPGVDWQRARRFVRSLPSENRTDNEDKGAFHGEIWTSAGISAGIDVMLSFVAEFYGGVEVARYAARALEYSWSEMKEGAVDPMYDDR